ncbi:hypothetical protein [Sorangium sp. So ce233]|uniref:hypothetical protein n=1 Tax=Sorangium sp. So ce233 TaxID=3133290 RepID=UPI003F643629
MIDKSMGVVGEAMTEVEEDVMELQLELDELDVVAGGGIGGCQYCPYCPYRSIGVRR